MKVLIENAVPLNNGDAALIFSIGDKLEESGADVYYSTFNIEKVKEKYPEKKWIKSKLDSKVMKLPFIGYVVLLLKVCFSLKDRSFEAVISAPGGYINSYYGFKRKVQLISFYKIFLKNKTYMYSQSIGPLNKKDENILAKYVRYFDVFYVRDDISLERIKKLIINTNNIKQTKDAAFLLSPIKSRELKDKKIALSVREWKHDSRSEKIYINLIKRIINYWVKKGYRVIFLSTCQGETSYTNDALFAQRIYCDLPKDIQKKVEIDSQYYKLEELREKLTNFDFIVGTRLHMCILSWLSGTPAMNISYEEKGRECYDYLNLEKYSIDYNFEGDVEKVITEFESVTDWSPTLERIREINKESVEYFNIIYNDILNQKTIKELTR